MSGGAVDDGTAMTLTPGAIVARTELLCRNRWNDIKRVQILKECNSWSNCKDRGGIKECKKECS